MVPCQSHTAERGRLYTGWRTLIQRPRHSLAARRQYHTSFALTLFPNFRVASQPSGVLRVNPGEVVRQLGVGIDTAYRAYQELSKKG